LVRFRQLLRIIHFFQVDTPNILWQTWLCSVYWDRAESASFH
jgi:hypothetical protein